MAGMSLRSGAKLSGMGEPPEKEGVPSGNEVEESPGERSDPERVTARNDAEDKGRQEERRGGGTTPRGSGRSAMRAERTQGERSPSEEQATVAGRGIAAPIAGSEGGRGGQVTPSGSGNSRRSLWEEGSRYRYTSLPKSLSLYDLGRKTDKLPRERERRGVGWGGALLAGEEAEQEDQERDRASKSRTRKPRSSAYSPGEEPVCYKCREPGHFKRDCPKLQTCSYCQRKGHQADNCYTKQREQKGRGGRRGRIEELEEELRRLRAEEEDTMAEEEKPVHIARYAAESDEEGPEPIFMATNPGREREDLGLRSGAADGRRGTATVRRGPRATVDEAVEEAAGAAEEAVQRAVARRWEDAGVYLERAASRRRMEEAARARVEELREARGLAEPAYDFETFNRPVRLVELFGGVGPGLAACVRLGMVVERWTYVEKNPEGRVGDGPGGAGAIFVGGLLTVPAPSSRRSFRYDGPRPPPSGQTPTQPESGSEKEDEEEDGEGEKEEDTEGSGDDSEVAWDPETHGGGEGGDDDDEDHEMDGLEPEGREEEVGEGGGRAATEAGSHHVREGGGSVGVKFRELLILLNRNCAQKNFIPSRWTVSRDTVVYAAAALQSAIAEMLAKEGELGCRVSFTIDMWTSPNNRAWLVVTGHWIDEYYQLRTMVFEFREIHGRHTGKQMARVVEETVVQWGLETRCLGFTSDNASSNTAAFRWMSEEGGGQCFFNSRMHFRCLAHVINLAVKAALAVTAICKLLKILREMASWIGYSPQRSGKFLGLQRTLNAQGNPAKPEPALKLGVSKADKAKMDTLRLTDADWETLHSVKTFLSPFAKVSKAAEGAAYPTVSMVLPYYNGLIDAMDSRLAKGPSATLKPMIEAALGLLKKYELMSSNELWIATFLDPSMKAAWFDDAHWETLHPDTERRARPRPSSDEEAGRGGMVQDDEVGRYLSERVRCDVSALEYWRSATNMQMLRRMARDYLAIPATSASSERVFSLGRNLISWKRHRLASQRTRASMILRSWYTSHPGQRIGEGRRAKGEAPPEFAIEGEGEEEDDEWEEEEGEEEQEGVGAGDTSDAEHAVVGSSSGVQA
ncbi:unnamed protein product [Closterium sp. NIES-64]|nr:unnamed protein product [Closterium sp. NIES-64]